MMQQYQLPLVAVLAGAVPMLLKMIYDGWVVKHHDESQIGFEDRKLFAEQFAQFQCRLMARVEVLDKIVAEQSARISEQDAEISNLKKKVGVLENDKAFLEERVKVLEEENTALKHTIAEMVAENLKLKKRLGAVAQEDKL